MENILHDFEEKVISLMTEFLKNSMEVGGLSNFTDNLNDKLMSGPPIFEYEDKKCQYTPLTNSCLKLRHRILFETM